MSRPAGSSSDRRSGRQPAYGRKRGSVQTVARQSAACNTPLEAWDVDNDKASHGGRPDTCIDYHWPGGIAARKRKTHDPNRTKSPSHASPIRTRVSLMNVPFALPISVTTSRPDGRNSRRAWARETDWSITLIPDAGKETMTTG